MKLTDANKIRDYVKEQINPYGKPFEGSVYEFGLKIMHYIDNMSAAYDLDKVVEELEERKEERERECNHINEALYDKGYSDGYNKAIEYFVMLFKSKTSMENSLVDEIAEQLKAGGENEDCM